MYLQLLLIASVNYLLVRSAPIQLSFGEIEAGVDARKWLHKYGYTSTYTPGIQIQELRTNIKYFQAFAGLPVTGILDKVTLKQMSLDRCGMADPIISIKRPKRYIHQGSDWSQLFDKTGKMELKWTLKNAGRSLPYGTVLYVMRQAFRYWHAKTNIDFIEIPLSRVGAIDGYNEEDIEILVSFEYLDHGDGYAFDGQGGTLAHAFYPQSNKGYSGDVHFDDSERYTYKSPHGKNLLWVATHELGHSLGLAHSNVKEAVMYPWYTAYKPGFKLNYDDIIGIQTLYGSRTKPMPDAITTTTTTTTTPKPISYSRKCPKEEGEVTAIFYSEMYRQFIALTKTNNMYLLGYTSRIPVLSRYKYLPKSRISEQINAVSTIEIDRRSATVYFAGSKYYISNKGLRLTSGEYSIHRGDGPLRLNFPLSIRTIDAAFTWQKNGKVYFFSGSQYWRYDNNKKSFDAGYPKQISKGWRGLPTRIDAAHSSKKNKETFFISGDQYYVFDNKNIRVKGQYSITTFMKCNNA